MASFSGKQGVNKAIGVMLIIIVGASVLPSAFDQWFNASTAEWPTMMASVWELVPFFGLLALALYMYTKID